MCSHLAMKQLSMRGNFQHSSMNPLLSVLSLTSPVISRVLSGQKDHLEVVDYIKQINII